MKKKILFLTVNLSGGGAEKVLIDILRNLDEKRYDVTLCTLFNQGVYLGDLPDFVRYRTVIKKPNKIKNALFWRLVKYLPPRWTYRLFLRGTYDTEIAFLEGLPTILLSKSPCKNKIAWVHTDLQSFNWVSFYYRSDRHLSDSYQQYNNVVFVSKQAKASYEEQFGPLDRGIVIYNPIDKAAILQRSEEFVPDQDPAVPVVCGVGRLIPIKGFRRLLNVHKRLIDEGVAHKLWLLGTGPEEQPIRDFIRENGLEDSVTLWGFQKNPYPFVKRADLFVCPSVMEGYPLSVGEALSLKKPIVATNCTGPTELLNNGTFGVLTENSEDGLYDALRCLLTDEEQRKKLKERAILGSESLDPSKLIRQIEALL